MERVTTDVTRNTDIDVFFEYGLYMPTATIYFGSTYFDEYGGENGVDFDSTAKFLKGLHLLEKQTDADLITVVINNPGGEEFHMFAIYDALKACSKWVNIECYGHAMSAASVIMQAGDRRFISPNSYMMIHDGDWSISGSPKTVKRWAEIGVKICDRMYEIYYTRMKEKNPNITIDQIRKICTHDTIYTAKEAVKRGLADEIIPDFNKTKFITGGKADGKKRQKEKDEEKRLRRLSFTAVIVNGDQKKLSNSGTEIEDGETQDTTT